jgi:hypothetical protein
MGHRLLRFDVELLGSFRDTLQAAEDRITGHVIGKKRVLIPAPTLRVTLSA